MKTSTPPFSFTKEEEEEEEEGEKKNKNIVFIHAWFYHGLSDACFFISHDHALVPRSSHGLRIQIRDSFRGKGGPRDRIISRYHAIFKCIMHAGCYGLEGDRVEEPKKKKKKKKKREGRMRGTGN